jgi:hypothetical protein
VAVVVALTFSVSVLQVGVEMGVKEIKTVLLEQPTQAVVVAVRQIRTKQTGQAVQVAQELSLSGSHTHLQRSSHDL